MSRDTTWVRPNPFSFLLHDRFVLQHNGQLKEIPKSENLWSLLKHFYCLPTTAPVSRDVSRFNMTPLIEAGILVREEETESLIRSEQSAFGNKSFVYFVLAAHQLGLSHWFEHNGRTPLLLISADGQTSATPSGTCIYDGLSFNCETLGAAAWTMNKAATNSYLHHAGFRVPPQVFVPVAWLSPHGASSDPGRLVSEIMRHAPSGFRYPVVIKPVEGSGGKGVAFAKGGEQLAEGLQGLSERYGGRMSFVVERYIGGGEWRVTVLSDGTHAAYERVRLVVRGDGSSSVGQLIDAAIAQRRSAAKKSGYIRNAEVPQAEVLKGMLDEKGLELGDRLDAGKRLTLGWRPHATMGAAHRDRTAEVPKALLTTLQDIRNRMGITRAGYDLRGGMSRRSGPYIIEVNSRPHLWVHDEPDLGSPQSMASAMLRIALSRPCSKRVLEVTLEACAPARQFGLA